MSRRANPALLGLFLIIGLALGIGAVLLFSSSRLFTPTKRYILYFDASLTGLDPGALVKFRGVTVGAVTDVLIHFNQRDDDDSLPVLVELNEALLARKTDGTFNLTDDDQFERYVARGLRATLSTQSFLTGLLYVDLVFQPDDPAVYHQVKPLHREIPTVPMGVQIFQLDFAETAIKLNAVLTRLDASLAALDFGTINREAKDVLASLNRVVASPSWTNAVASLDATLGEVRELSSDVRERLPELASDLEAALSEGRTALAALRAGMEDLRAMVGADAWLRRDVSEVTGALERTARAAAELADLLRRHPNAVLTGRSEGGER